MHHSSCSLDFCLGLIEVGMRVEEQKAVAAATLQREQAAEDDRAVAAEDNRNCPRIQQCADCVGEYDRVISNASRIEQQGVGIALGLVGERLDPAGMHRAEPLGESRGEQRLWQRLDPFGNRPRTEGASRVANRPSAMVADLLRFGGHRHGPALPPDPHLQQRLTRGLLLGSGLWKLHSFRVAPSEQRL